LLLALGAAGVTLAVVLGVIGLPAVNACSSDPRGLVTCLRDMADRKFDLPGTIPGQVAEAPVEVPAEPAIIAETGAPTASGGPLEAPAVEPAAVAAPVAIAAPEAKPIIPEPVETAAAPALVVSPTPQTKPAEPAPAQTTAPTAPIPAAVEMAAIPEPRVSELEPQAQPGPVEDTALTWSAPSTTPVAAAQADEPAAVADGVAVQTAEPTTPSEPLLTEPAITPEASLPPAIPSQPAPAAPPAVPAQEPLVVANAEPAGSQPPAPTVAVPVVLAPTIDAIELDGTQSFVSGSGPAGALMRLYADGELIGESPVEDGRWLVEGSNLLDSPRRELRVEAIEPDTGKLLGVAAITVEIELPDGGTPPDERTDEPPEPGSDAAPAAETGHPALAEPVPATTPTDTPAPADITPPTSVDVSPVAPTADLPQEPEPLPETEVAAVEPEPEPLPAWPTNAPRGESASVEILAPSKLQPTELSGPEEDAADPSTITLPIPDAPALVAEFDVPAPPPSEPPGEPVTILRLLPFGDPDEGRYNVGKAIIRRGDTLWSIARRYYGHGIHYRTIFHANRDLIGRPSRIFPGQIFDLPLVTDD
jgi:nucleoid-associated protein YgaU